MKKIKNLLILAGLVVILMSANASGDKDKDYPEILMEHEVFVII